MNDLFLVCNNAKFSNYADDTSPYSCEKNIDLVLGKLDNDSKDLTNWFKHNGLKANPKKFHLILSNPDEKLFIKIDDNILFNSKSEKSLGIKINNKMTFDEHVLKLCKTANQKLCALARMANFMSKNQRKVVMKAFIKSQFGHCPLVWMFHSRKLNNYINKIHERSLRIVYKDEFSTFQDLLKKDMDFTIHQRNIQALAIEMYKVVNGLSPKILSDIFPLKKTKMYASTSIFRSHIIHTTKYGILSIGNIGPKIWSKIPTELKEVSNLIIFKEKIIKWKPVGCPCNICRTYIPGVGYID